jgi:hypothetical protein
VPDIDRRVLIVAVLSAVLVFVIGLGIGVAISGGSGDARATTSTIEGSPSSTASTTSDDGSTSSPTTGVLIEGDATAALVPPKTDAADIPEYGSQNDRENLIVDLALAGVATGSREDILAAADRICYNLERLEAQKRSPAFAVRVVWNESLAELESQDLAAFAALFAATPFYLCPDSLDYSNEIAYWLGY